MYVEHLERNTATLGKSARSIQQMRLDVQVLASHLLHNRLAGIR